MKVRAETDQVVVVLTPRESMAFAQQLIKAAIQSAPSTDLTKEPAEESTETEHGT